MERTYTAHERACYQVDRYLSSITIPKTTRTNYRDFAIAWMSKYGGTYNNAIGVWRITYHEEHSRDLSKPYIPLS